MRCLLVHFSHSGDVSSILEGIAKCIETQGADLVRAEITLKEGIPFPWRFWDFLGALPGTVLGRQLDLAPLGISSDEDFDWVILGWQVWYLHPSQPIQAFLASPEAEILRGQRLITVGSCRHMWQQALISMRARLCALGAKRKLDLVVTHDHHGFISFVTTPLFLLTGKRYKVRAINDKIGKSDRISRKVCDLIFEAKSSSSVGMAEPDHGDMNCSLPVDPNFVLAEILGVRFMRFWAGLADQSARVHTALIRPTLLMFILTLAFLIPVGLFASFVGRWLWQFGSPSTFDCYIRSLRS